MTRRVLAFVWDYAAVSVLSLAVATALGIGYRCGGTPAEAGGSYMRELAVWLLIWVCYFGFLEGGWGRTLGKWAMRLRVDVTIQQAMQRALLVAMTLECLPCLTMLWLTAVDPQGTWDDLMHDHPVLWLMCPLSYPMGLALAAWLWWRSCHAVARS